MTTVDISHQHTPVQRRRLMGTMAAVVPLVAVMEAVYYFGGLAGTEDSTPVRAAAVASAVGALAAYAVWRFGRGAYGSARATKVMAVLAIVSIVGFWIGVTFPVALAAVLFGRETLAGGGRGAGYLAIAAGAVTLAAATVLCVLGAS